MQDKRKIGERPVKPIQRLSVDEQRALDKLEAHLKEEADGSRCGVCRQEPTLAWKGDPDLHKCTWFLRCGCFPNPPVVESLPETPMQYYERTGEGDALTIMQVENRRARKSGRMSKPKSWKREA